MLIRLSPTSYIVTAADLYLIMPGSCIFKFAKDEISHIETLTTTSNLKAKSSRNSFLERKKSMAIHPLLPYLNIKVGLHHPYLI